MAPPPPVEFAGTATGGGTFNGVTSAMNGGIHPEAAGVEPNPKWEEDEYDVETTV